MTPYRTAGVLAIAAALPTIVWRIFPGVGVTLGTPASWRAREQLPGSGTAYVIGLSVLQLVAALLTLVLIVPGADTLTGRRFPARLVFGAASLGAGVLAAVCVLSVVNWHKVNPFGDAAGTSGWSVLCTACYAAALAWPVLLAFTIAGYARGRRQP